MASGPRLGAEGGAVRMMKDGRGRWNDGRQDAGIREKKERKRAERERESQKNQRDRDR